MSINIYDVYNNLTKNFYGLDTTSATDQEKVDELTKEFYLGLDNEHKSYMDSVLSSDEGTVNGALLSLSQGIDKGSVSTQIDAVLAYAASAALGDPAVRRILSSNDAETISSYLYGIMGTLSGVDAADLGLPFINQLSSKMAALATELQPLYMAFLAEKLQSVYVTEAPVALSPNEIEKRRIVFEIFSLAMSMLTALQKASTLAGSAMAYYTRVQREYMDLMSQIQLYGPEGKYSIVANATDFGKTQLGYGNTTVRNVLDYLIEKIKTTVEDDNGLKYVRWAAQSGFGGPIITFELQEKTAASGDPGYVFRMYVPKQQTGVISNSPPGDPGLAMSYNIFSTAKCNQQNGDLYYGLDLTEFGGSSSTDSSLYQDNLYIPNTTLGQSAQNRDLVSRMLEHITQQWNQSPDSSFSGSYMVINYVDSEPTPSPLTINLKGLKQQWAASDGTNFGNFVRTYLYGPAGLAWVDVPDEDEDKAKTQKDAASGFRSETNAQIQVYLQNAQSLKQLAEDTGKSAESVLSQIQQSQENQINLISAIIESLRGLLTAIFR